MGPFLGSFMESVMGSVVVSDMGSIGLVSHVAGLRVSSVMESVIGSVSNSLHVMNHDVNQVLKVTICVKILNRQLRNRRCVGSGI